MYSLRDLKMLKLVGGWPTPLKNMKVRSQLGWLFPIYGKIKNDPNHQPGRHFILVMVSLSMLNDHDCFFVPHSGSSGTWGACISQYWEYVGKFTQQNMRTNWTNQQHFWIACVRAQAGGSPEVHIWLVVDLPLWKILVSWDYYSQYTAK